MYQVHHTFWLGVGFFACALLAAAFAVLAQLGKVKPRSYVFFVLLGLAMAQMLALQWRDRRDDDQLRRELKQVDPLSVSNLLVEAGGSRREIEATNQLDLIFTELHQIKAVRAHHSHPTVSFEVQFNRGGYQYRYWIGRDSERPDEYWVFETARAGSPGREIGRIHSPTLGKVLEGPVHGASPPK